MIRFHYDYEAVVIGGGAAGLSAALTLGRKGKKVAVIEARRIGGIGLNATDLPFETANYGIKLLRLAREGQKLGLSSSGLRYNYPTLMNWRERAEARFETDLRTDIKAANLELIPGTGRLLSKHSVGVGDRVIEAKKIILATGSVAKKSGIKIAARTPYYTPKNILQLKRPVRTAVVVGGGATGCALAQYLQGLGAKVIVFDLAHRLLPREDEETGGVLEEVMTHQGIKVLPETRVVELMQAPQGTRVIFMRGGQEKYIYSDMVVIATGVAPNLDLGLENANLAFSSDGIVVDRYMRTSIRNIYAAGDVTEDGCNNSSTERAKAQGEVVAKQILGQKRVSFEKNEIIRKIDTYPEIAAIGETEDSLTRADKKYQKTLLALNEVVRAKIEGQYGGFIKILTTKRGEKILGASAMLPHADMLMHEIALAMKHNLSLSDLASMPHLESSWNKLIQKAAEKTL